MQTAKGRRGGCGGSGVGMGAQPSPINTAPFSLPHYMGDIREQAASPSINKTLHCNELSGPSGRRDIYSRMPRSAFFFFSF